MNSHCPQLFTSYKCTDYEYALNSVSQAFGVGHETWQLQYPGISPKHFYPRQPKHLLECPVKQARMITAHQDNTRITELVMPWYELLHVKALLDAGKPVRFSYKVNNNT